MSPFETERGEPHRSNVRSLDATPDEFVAPRPGYERGLESIRNVPALLGANSVASAALTAAVAQLREAAGSFSAGDHLGAPTGAAPARVPRGVPGQSPEPPSISGRAVVWRREDRQRPVEDDGPSMAVQTLEDQRSERRPGETWSPAEQLSERTVGGDQDAFCRYTGAIAIAGALLDMWVNCPNANSGVSSVTGVAGARGGTPGIIGAASSAGWTTGTYVREFFPGGR